MKVKGFGTVAKYVPNFKVKYKHATNQPICTHRHSFRVAYISSRLVLYVTDRQTFPHLQDSHKCPCADGLECKVTKQLTIPGILGITESITLSLKQCMPVEENVEVEEVELTEE